MNTRAEDAVSELGTLATAAMRLNPQNTRAGQNKMDAAHRAYDAYQKGQDPALDAMQLAQTLYEAALINLDDIPLDDVAWEDQPATRRAQFVLLLAIGLTAARRAKRLTRGEVKGLKFNEETQGYEADFDQDFLDEIAAERAAIAAERAAQGNGAGQGRDGSNE